MTTYAFYSGSSSYVSSPQILKAFYNVAKKMKLQLIELPETTSSGDGRLQDLDDFLALVLNARNLCYAKQTGHALLVLDYSDYFYLNRAKELLNNNESIRTKVNEKLKEVGLEYQTGIEIVLFDNLLTTIELPQKKKFHDFNLAPFYGTYFNTQEKPACFLDEMITKLGSTLIKHDAQYANSGTHINLQDTKTSDFLLGQVLMSALDSNADYLVTNCEKTYRHLQNRQGQASRRVGRSVKLNVISTPELLEIAFA